MCGGEARGASGRHCCGVAFFENSIFVLRLLILLPTFVFYSSFDNPILEFCSIDCGGLFQIAWYLSSKLHQNWAGYFGAILILDRDYFRPAS